MSHEDQDTPQAGCSGGHDHQGRLSREGGRSAETERPPEALFRLKRSVELYPAVDGDLYLLRLGAGDDQVVQQPSAEERAILRELAGEFVSPGELRDRIQRQGHSAEALEGALEQMLVQGLLETRFQPRPLSEPQAERFDRQLIYLADLAPAETSADQLQLRIAEAHVVVIGCGGLGSWAATGLSLSGVGQLTLIDDDRVDLSNLNRQLLFRPDQIGQLKVDAAQESLLGHNPEQRISTHALRIGSPRDLSQLLDDSVSLVISTGDWPPHQLPRWVNRVAIEMGIPWIGAGQFPPRLRIGPMVVPGESACLECLETAARASHPLYEQVAEFRVRRRSPDPSVGPVSAVIGSLLASEAMHFLVGLRPASVDHALLLDLQTMSLSQEAVARRPDCSVCGKKVMAPAHVA